SMRVPGEIAGVVRANELDHAAHDRALDVAALPRVDLDHLAPAALRVGAPAVEREFRGARALREDREDAARAVLAARTEAPEVTVDGGERIGRPGRGRASRLLPVGHRFFDLLAA